MRIAILGPISTESVAHLLDVPASNLPSGPTSAPVLGALISALVHRGHHVDAFTLVYGAAMAPGGFLVSGRRFSLRYLPGRARALRMSGRLPGRALDAFRAERRVLVDALYEGAYDVVHAHWLYEYAAAALDQSVAPAVITAHDEPAKVLRYMMSMYRLVRFGMALRALRRAPVVTAVSPYLATALSRYRTADVQVVPNPLPSDLTSHDPQSRRIGPGEPLRIGMVLNGWSRLKNPKPAIRAFHGILASLPRGSELELIGADYGPNGPAHRWASRHALDRGVCFAGELPHDAVLRRIQAMHVLVNPSLEESFGVAIAEAMSLGVPVVAGARSGAVPWLLANGAAGTLVDVRSADSIALGLRDAIADLHAGVVASTAFALRRVRGLCDACIVAARYEALYRSAAQAQPRAPLPPLADEIPERPFTVLHILNELMPSGAETMLRSAGPQWARHGIRCRVLSLGSDPGPFAPELEAAGYRTRHLPFSSTPRFFGGLVSELRATRPDAVHVHTERASFWIALAARLAGVSALVRTVHSNFIFSGELRVRRWLSRAATRLLAVRHAAISEGVRDTEWRRFRNHTLLAHNWYDSSRFVCFDPDARARARTRLGLRDEQKVLLTVGNCSDTKNHVALLNALAAVQDERLIYLHAGTEQAGEPERRLAEQLGLARQVRFLGPADPVSLLQAADLFVMPSLREGFSIAALEAIGTGTPTLLADVAGLRDFRLHFRAPRYCAPSARALADAIREWLSGDSAELRAVAAEDARTARDHFGIEQGVARYVALYGMAHRAQASAVPAKAQPSTGNRRMPG